MFFSLLRQRTHFPLVAPLKIIEYDSLKQSKSAGSTGMSVEFPDSRHVYQQEIDRLSRLVEISLVVNSTLDLRALLSTIMNHAAEITGAESASIMLYDQKSGQLRFVATSTSPEAPELLDIPVPLDGSIAGSILRDNAPVMLDDVSQDPRHFRSTDEKSGFVTRSLLGVPMCYKDKPIGVLEAVNKKSGTWADNDRRSLIVLASQAAIAIKNAQMVEQLRRAYNELDQLGKLKDDFISIASHELRTPLSVILGYASFLREDASDELSAHAAAVLNSALRMRNLIEDMTNLRYLKMGEADIQRERVPLAAIFQAAAHDVKGMADAKGHALHVDMPDERLVVVVDRVMFGMALTNLLYNAIKFTPRGGSITMTYERMPRAAWIKVIDTGVGIPPDLLERIFDAFFQVEHHMTRQHGGMGLGLAIARGLVAAHGGHVWAESEGPGSGSTFIVNLPLPD